MRLNRQKTANQLKPGSNLIYKSSELLNLGTNGAKKFPEERSLEGTIENVRFTEDGFVEIELQMGRFLRIKGSEIRETKDQSPSEDSFNQRRDAPQAQLGAPKRFQHYSLE